jgi:hypothetical protein
MTTNSYSFAPQVIGFVKLPPVERCADTAAHQMNATEFGFPAAVGLAMPGTNVSPTGTETPFMGT